MIRSHATTVTSASAERIVPEDDTLTGGALALDAADEWPIHLAIGSCMGHSSGQVSGLRPRNRSGAVVTGVQSCMRCGRETPARSARAGSVEIVALMVPPKASRVPGGGDIETTTAGGAADEASAVTGGDGDP
jgi:hypothetical protein